MERQITKNGLTRNAGNYCVLSRGTIRLEGMLLFGDIRDEGIAADYYRKNMKEEPYLIAANLRWTGKYPLPRGMSRLGARSKRYDGWNIPIKEGDKIIIFSSNFNERNYKVGQTK